MKLLTSQENDLAPEHIPDLRTPDKTYLGGKTMKHKRLYVGNLPASTTEDDLSGLFGELGTIESITLMKNATVQTFAFIEMASPDAAREAVRKFNGFVIDGRQLIVHTVPPKSRPRSAVSSPPARR